MILSAFTAFQMGAGKEGQNFGQYLEVWGLAPKGLKSKTPELTKEEAIARAESILKRAREPKEKE